MLSMTVRQFNTDESAKLVRRAVALFNMCLELVVCFIFAPVLCAQGVENTTGVPISPALRAFAVKVEHCLTPMLYVSDVNQASHWCNDTAQYMSTGDPINDLLVR